MSSPEAAQSATKTNPRASPKLKRTPSPKKLSLTPDEHTPLESSPNQVIEEAHQGTESNLVIEESHAVDSIPVAGESKTEMISSALDESVSAAKPAADAAVVETAKTITTALKQHQSSQETIVKASSSAASIASSSQRSSKAPSPSSFTSNHLPHVSKYSSQQSFQEFLTSGVTQPKHSSSAWSKDNTSLSTPKTQSKYDSFKRQSSLNSSARSDFGSPTAQTPFSPQKSAERLVSFDLMLGYKGGPAALIYGEDARDRFWLSVAYDRSRILGESADCRTLESVLSKPSPRRRQTRAVVFERTYKQH